MVSKQQRSKSRKNIVRLQNQAATRPSGLKSFSLIVGVIALTVIIVSVLAILGQGSSRPSGLGPAEVSSDKSIGPKDAPVVVVEYADFQCPYCRQFAIGTEHQLRQGAVQAGKVRFVFRHLAFIGPESVWAAEAVECANEQDRFWDYHDRLFEEQAGENSGTFSQENLKSFAAELGLDSQQFNQCLDSQKYQAKVQQEVTEAARLGIHSTPTLFVNGQLIQNGSNHDVLQSAIEAALIK